MILREKRSDILMNNSKGIRAVYILQTPKGASVRLNPSKWDTMITDRMLKVCELVGIPLRAHIIVGGDNRSYFSFF